MVQFADYTSEYRLSQDFCKHHFLVGLLLQEVKTSLNEVVQIRKVAIVTLRDLLAKHELDDRYRNKVCRQATKTFVLLPRAERYLNILL